jgi:hypothetical protein
VPVAREFVEDDQCWRHDDQCADEREECHSSMRGDAEASG